MDRIIVTMTTIPDRLMAPVGGLREGLKTVLEQSGPAHEVHLNIPLAYRGSRITPPDWLAEWQEIYPHFKIFRCTDFGPITKIYPTLQRERDPDTILITIDDDLYYCDGIIPAHLDGQARYPGCAVGFAGMTSIEPTIVGRYHFASSMPEDIRVRMIEGYKTVSYRRSFFSDDFDKFAFAHWNDDISISAYLGYKNIKKMILKCPDCTDYTSRVETFPVIRHVPLAGGVGCNVFRQDEKICNESQLVAAEWYRLHYLEQ